MVSAVLGKRNRNIAAGAGNAECKFFSSLFLLSPSLLSFPSGPFYSPSFYLFSPVVTATDPAFILIDGVAASLFFIFPSLGATIRTDIKKFFSVSSAETARLKRRTRVVVNDENEDPIVVSQALVFDGFKDVPATLPPKRRPAVETPALLSPIKQQQLLPRSRPAAAATAAALSASAPASAITATAASATVTAAPQTISGMREKPQRPLSKIFVPDERKSVHPLLTSLFFGGQKMTMMRIMSCQYRRQHHKLRDGTAMRCRRRRRRRRRKRQSRRGIAWALSASH
jgi:hypothetical protein